MLSHQKSENMMNINQEEDKIFGTYPNGKTIIKDGMIDEHEYLKSPVRVLFLLREPRGYVNKEQDLRVFGRNGGNPKTWNLAMRIAKIFIEEKNEFERTSEKRAEYAKKVIWMNNKKFPGGSQANRQEIRETTETYKDLLKKQFELYNQENYIPHIIYCCGTIDCYRKIFLNVPLGETYTFDYTNKQGKQCRATLEYLVDEHNWKMPCVVVNGYHPGQLKISHEKYGEEMLKLWQTIRKQNNIVK